MGIDIAGVPIIKNAGAGVTLNSSLVFNSAGQGTANPIPGYTGYKNSGNYWSAPTGWETNVAQWQSGLNATNGIFTCPVAGYYAMGYNGIHRGASNLPEGYNTYGYSGFGKNGALSYYVHWNMGTQLVWSTGGVSALFSCAAGDTLALYVNRAPTPLPPNYVDGYGLYPNEHHAIWCKLVG
jgi:hypothetical protein